jgi:hypothetical protein
MDLINGEFHGQNTNRKKETFMFTTIAKRRPLAALKLGTCQVFVFSLPPIPYAYARISSYIFKRFWLLEPHHTYSHTLAVQSYSPLSRLPKDCKPVLRMNSIKFEMGVWDLRGWKSDLLELTLYQFVYAQTCSTLFKRFWFINRDTANEKWHVVTYVRYKDMPQVFDDAQDELKSASSHES